MKPIFFCLLIIASVNSYAQTGIGTTTPHASAKLEISSTDKGFLPPRMTSSQRTNISSPAAGLMVYQTDGTAGLYYYNGSAWIYIINSTTGVLPVSNGGTGVTSSTGSGNVVLSNTPTLLTPIISSGDTQFPSSINVSPTTHSTSKRAALWLDGWGIMQDILGDGTKNFSISQTYGGTYPPRLLINTEGNIGIGTTAPTAKLNIAGGGIKIHNGFSRSTARPALNTSTIGNYEIRGVGSITGTTQMDSGDDGFLRLSAGGGSSVLAQSSIDLSGGSDNTDMNNTIVMRTAGVERLRINSNGNVGIGNSSPGATLEIGSSNGSVPGSLILNPTTTGTGVEGAEIQFKPAPVFPAQTWVIDQVSNANNPRLRFFPSPNGETRGFTITDNGYLGIGTATPRAKLHVQTADNNSLYIESTTNDNNGMVILNANTNQSWGNNWHEFMMFQNQGTTIGHISGGSNGSAITYSTTSDYRLKNDLKLFNGMELINKIKTYDFAWKSGGSRMFGVMAHELQEVIPYLVSGKKDAVDSNGKIIPQTVDYGQLTPILIKALQEQDVKLKEQQKQMDELIRRLEVLENKK